LTVSNACFSGSSSEALPSAALMPPSAAPEWLRTGWILERTATSAPASNASIAARMPAQPAPTISTSCFASTSFDVIGKRVRPALRGRGGLDDPDRRVGALEPLGAFHFLQRRPHDASPLTVA